MAVAFDAASESHTGTTGSVSEASFSWTHTPVGTPRGVTVFVVKTNSTGSVDSVTYGGVPMTFVDQAADTSTEVAQCRAYHLSSGIPTGAQTITVNRSNDGNTQYAIAFTVTAADNTEAHGVVKLEEDGTIAEQNVDDGSPGANSLRLAAGFSGRTTPPSVGANSTAGPSIQFLINSVVSARETTPGQGSRPVGFSEGTSDDRAILHLAIREAPLPPVTSTIASTLGKLGAAFSVTQTAHVTSTISSSMKKLAASFAGTPRQTGAISATLKPLAADFWMLPAIGPTPPCDDGQDVLVQSLAGCVAGGMGGGGAIGGPVWTTQLIGYVFYYFTDEGPGNIAGREFWYKKTEDGGQTWGAGVQISAPNHRINGGSVWYDRRTEGDTGDLIHITWHTEHDGSNQRTDWYYRNLDTTTDILSAEVTAFVGANVSASSFSGHSRITKSISGTLYILGVSYTTVVKHFLTSTDGGATWSPLADPFTGEDVNETGDYWELMPADALSDTDAVWSLYLDISAGQLSLKVFDPVGVSWSETIIYTGIVYPSVGYHHSGVLSWAQNPINRHVIVAAWTAGFTPSATLKAWDIEIPSVITPLQDVLHREDNAWVVDVFCDGSDGINIAYNRGDVPDAYRSLYRRSIDGGASWLEERDLSASCETFCEGIHSGGSNPEGQYTPAFGGSFGSIYVNPDFGGLVLGGGSDGVVTSNIPDDPPEGICDFSGTNGPVVMRPRFKWRDSFFNDLGEVGTVCGVTFEPAVIDGHVTFDPARTITRDITLTFNLANLPEEMRGPAAPQKLAKRWISAEMLVTVAGEDFGFPFGIFQLSADVGESMRENGQDRLTCKGYDPAILLTATTEQSYTVDSGTAYTDAVVTILDALGITLRAVYASVRILPVDATWPVGTQWIAIINDLLTGLNYWPIWFDGDGKAWVWYRGNPEQESFGVNVVYSAIGDYRMIMAPFERSLTGADQPNQIVASVDDPARAPLSVTVRNETLPPNGIEVIGRTISADRRFDRVADADVLAGLAEWELVASRAKAHSATLLTFPDPRRNPRGRLREIYQLQLGTRLDADPSVNEPARTYWMCSGWEMDLTHPGVVMTHKIESILPLGALEVEFAFTSDGGLVIGGTGGPGDGSIPPIESDGGLVIGGSASVIVAVV